MKTRDTPCERCGWRYPGYHICVDLATPEPEVKPVKKRKSTYSRGVNETQRYTPEWKAAVKEGREGYRLQLREKNKDRDETIVRIYDNGLTVREVAQSLGVARHTVRRVLHIAQNEGTITIRRAGRRSKE